MDQKTSDVQEIEGVLRYKVLGGLFIGFVVVFVAVGALNQDQYRNAVALATGLSLKYLAPPLVVILALANLSKGYRLMWRVLAQKTAYAVTFQFALAMVMVMTGGSYVLAINQHLGSTKLDPVEGTIRLKKAVSPTSSARNSGGGLGVSYSLVIRTAGGEVKELKVTKREFDSAKKGQKVSLSFYEGALGIKYVLWRGGLTLRPKG